jgi:hypothetical protein
MNYFEILSNLCLIRKVCDAGCFSHGEDCFEFNFSRHSTGQHINVYLVDGDKNLRVYYDTEWFHSCYKFNENGKKHGHLIDNAPWIPVLEAKFAQFEKEILEVEKKRKLVELKQKQEEEDKDRELVEYFKGKFS